MVKEGKIMEQNNQITKIAWDLNEQTENRYELVYQIAELAKRMIDEAQMRKPIDEFDYEGAFDPATKKEKPIQQAIIMKATENSDGELVG